MIKSGAADKVEMVTPTLTSGTFKYTLTLRDSNDSTKTKDHVVHGIVAGKTVTVDLRTIELASL